LVSLAEKARKEGLLALEAQVKDIEDPFLKRGLQMGIDGTDPEELRAVLEGEIAAKKAEDKVGAKFFTAMGGYAPTVGIIGTVVGLIHVLENLSNPEALGPLIAGAFVATLWGVLSANIFWLPMGAKITRISELQAAQMELLVEGITEIQAGTSPRAVRQKLTAPVTQAPEEARGGGAREPRAVAGLLRRHGHPPHVSVHRPVRDEPGRQGQVRRARLRTVAELRRPDHGHAGHHPGRV